MREIYSAAIDAGIYPKALLYPSAPSPPSPPPARGLLPKGRDILFQGVPPIIPRLSDAMYEYGNVRLGHAPAGAVVAGAVVSEPISRDAAEAIPLSRRQNRKGLVYDASFPGFEVASWPHVLAAPAFGHGEHRFWLEGGDPGGELDEPTLLDVHYDPSPDPRLCPWAESLYEMHKTCREGDPQSGGMVGVGQHLRRTGHLGNFVTTGDRESERRVVAGFQQSAGQVFAHHFGGRGVGFERMVVEQSRLWGTGASHCYPLAWAASSGLGNSEHCDPDGSRSYAVWVSGHGHASMSESWWLLFPRHGVAVQIIHGTWISWDGRVQPHCSAVPMVAAGDALMSLFCALPANAMRVRERMLAGADALRKRSAPEPDQAVDQEVDDAQGERVGKAHALFASLRDGMEVVYRWVDEAPAHLQSKRARVRWGKANVRWVQGKVMPGRKTDTHVTIRDKHGPGIVTFSIHEVGNQLYIP